jgi:hypothetical protein
MTKTMTNFTVSAGTGAGELYVALHGEQPPDDASWQQWVETLRAASEKVRGDLGQLSNLVITDGGAPTTAQRVRVTELIADGHTEPRVAVVTDSTVVRLAVRAFALFNPQTRAFAPNAFIDALGHCGIDRAEASRILGVIEERAVESFGASSLRAVRATRAAIGR